MGYEERRKALEELSQVLVGFTTKVEQVSRLSKQLHTRRQKFFTQITNFPVEKAICDEYKVLVLQKEKKICAILTPSLQIAENAINSASTVFRELRATAEFMQNIQLIKNAILTSQNALKVWQKVIQAGEEFTNSGSKEAFEALRTHVEYLTSAIQQTFSSIQAALELQPMFDELAESAKRISVPEVLTTPLPELFKQAPFKAAVASLAAVFGGLALGEASVAWADWTAILLGPAFYMLGHVNQLAKRWRDCVGGLI